MAAGLNKTGTVNASRIPEESSGIGSVDGLCQEMNNLMHDYEVVSRITSLVSTLKGEYDVSLQKLFAFYSISFIFSKCHHNNQSL